MVWTSARQRPRGETAFPRRARCPCCVFPPQLLREPLTQYPFSSSLSGNNSRPCTGRTSLGRLCYCTETQGTLEGIKYLLYFQALRSFLISRERRRLALLYLMSQENCLRLQCQTPLIGLLRVWIWSLAMPDSFGFWQKGKKKKNSSDLCPRPFRDPWSPANPAAARTHNIQGWFSALCLPPGIEKKVSLGQLCILKLGP